MCVEQGSMCRSEARSVIAWLQQRVDEPDDRAFVDVVDLERGVVRVVGVVDLGRVDGLDDRHPVDAIDRGAEVFLDRHRRR